MTDEPLDPRVVRSKSVVLDAAAELLLAGGIAAVTIDGLVAACGVAKTTIYRHWSNRAELVWDTLDSLLPGVPELPDGQPIREALTAVLVGASLDLDGARWASLIPAMLDAAERDPEMSTFRARIADRHVRPLRQFLATGVANGELEPDLDIDVAVSELAGPLIYRRFVTRETVDEAFCARHVERFLRYHGR